MQATSQLSGIRLECSESVDGARLDWTGKAYPSTSPIRWPRDGARGLRELRAERSVLYVFFINYHLFPGCAYPLLPLSGYPWRVDRFSKAFGADAGWPEGHRTALCNRAAQESRRDGDQTVCKTVKSAWKILFTCGPLSFKNCQEVRQFCKRTVTKF